MSHNLRKLGIFSALVAFTLVSTSQAATFTIIPSQSTLNLSIDLGAFDEDEESETFGQYVPLIFADAQGDLPDGTIPAGDGTRVPGFSNGLSAQVDGTIQVNEGGFSLPGGSNIVLLDSGLWQPGEYLGDDMDGNPIYGDEPASSQVGIVLDLNPLGLDLVLTGALSQLALDITTGNMTLGPNGEFSDPDAILSLLSVALDGSFSGSLAPVFGLSTLREVLDGVDEVTPISGTFENGVLTIPVFAELFVDLEEVLGLPLVLRVVVDGEIVAIPEPSSIAMLGMGIVGLGAVVYRRRRK